ncbi:MAG: hypothetical protein SVU32_07700 [Candidatus Nanohaloarchaea archaeon]|nr:hypothetical protein [Candidatus Nanohaloarchaea archaeon]
MTDDDGIVIDLTHPYEMDWMARGRKEQEYKAAFRDQLQEEYGLDACKAERIDFGGLFGDFRVPERDWDVIWQDDHEPGVAMERYLGEARVRLAVLDQQDRTDEELYEEVKERAERERQMLQASRNLERYLMRNGFEDYEISGIGPWHDTSPYEVDEEWAAVLDHDIPAVLGHEETPVLVEELGEEYVLETAGDFVDNDNATR